MSWRDEAACTGLDPAIFYPTRGDDPAPARVVCSQCPVRRDCLEHSLNNRELLGIWGGISERGRRRLMGLVA